MEEAQKNGDDTMYETYKKGWEAAAQAQSDAQDAMLSKTEEWAEAQRAIVENELADLGKQLEQALTGGTDFDTVNTAMERASSLQEEYLTTTNKIYETNKLMRQAQQEIDKTTNTVAKNRMKQFINETQ
jgi:glutamyl-tRNA reductase